MHAIYIRLIYPAYMFCAIFTQHYVCRIYNLNAEIPKEKHVQYLLENISYSIILELNNYIFSEN